MKTKMKVAVCTLLCMTMACAAANAEGGTTNSTNSGRPQTQQSQMKNRKKKGMQQGQMPGMDEQGQAPDMNGQNNGQKPNDGAQENRQQNGNNKQNSNNGMQQKPDDQNAPKDMPSRVDTRKLLEDGVIDEDTYNAIEEYLKENAPEKPEGEQDDTQQPPEKPEDEADDDSADQPELPEIGGGLDEAQLKSLLDAGVITQAQYDTLLELLTGSGDAA